MGKITLQQAAAWCGGIIDPKYADVEFLGANNDTRILKPGQLFLALKGARDGHDFIPQAIQKGASAVLCEHCDVDFPAIVVEDVRIALGRIANGERKRIGMKVVGRGIPREHCDLYTMDGKKIGWVSSGTHCPFIGQGVAMGYIPVEEIEIGKHLNADVRGRMVEVEIVKLPFYKIEK